MTIFKIEPVHFNTAHSECVVVTGIHAFDPDPFRGYVINKDGSRFEAKFRSNGYVRDDHPYRNIPMATEHGAALARAARVLRRED